MKFAVASAALVASAAATYDIEYVTKNTTTEITITSCSHNACATTVKPAIQTTITETVNGVETIYTTVCPLTQTTVTTTVEGVETVYTTVCPLTETTAETATPATTEAETPASEAATPATETPATTAPTTLAAESLVVTPATSSEEDSYIDLTTTPVSVVSTPVEATVYTQSSFTSTYNSSSAAVSTFEGGANLNAVGAAGIVGVVAMLI